MSNIKMYLKQLDNKLNELQPKTMDDLINIVLNEKGGESYGVHFSIVKYMGYLQGIRVYITGRNKSHQLPGKGKVYSVIQGTEHFEKAGWQIENS